MLLYLIINYIKSILYLLVVTLFSFLLVLSYYYNSFIQYSNIAKLQDQYDYIISEYKYLSKMSH